MLNNTGNTKAKSPRPLKSKQFLKKSEEMNKVKEPKNLRSLKHERSGSAMDVSHNALNVAEGGVFEKRFANIGMAPYEQTIPQKMPPITDRQTMGSFYKLNSIKNIIVKKE